jgi:hypothetical protein
MSLRSAADAPERREGVAPRKGNSKKLRKEIKEFENHG